MRSLDSCLIGLHLVVRMSKDTGLSLGVKGDEGKSQALFASRLFLKLYHMSRASFILLCNFMKLELDHISLTIHKLTDPTLLSPRYGTGITFEILRR